MTAPTLLYLVGPPGAGKSTLMAQLTSPWVKQIRVDDPLNVPHTLLLHPESNRITGAELGVPREDFPGTDSLAMNIGPRAAKFLDGYPHSFLLGEGARLGTRPFFTAAMERGYSLRIAFLEADQELLDARCERRGSSQDPIWRKGANTRARNIAEWAKAMHPSALVWYLDATLTPSQLRGILVDALPQLDPANAAVAA